MHWLGCWSWGCFLSRYRFFVLSRSRFWFFKEPPSASSQRVSEWQDYSLSLWPSNTRRLPFVFLWEGGSASVVSLRFRRRTRARAGEYHMALYMSTRTGSPVWPSRCLGKDKNELINIPFSRTGLLCWCWVCSAALRLGVFAVSLQITMSQLVDQGQRCLLISI